LKHLRELLATRNPASIRICTAFDKPERRKVEIFVDYIGMQIPDEFIVGYGLDLDERYRNLPEIAVLNSDTAPADDQSETAVSDTAEVVADE
jgi:hypoxanthine phosphoribosyltransferase